MVAYPSAYPCPQVEGYQVNTDFSIQRTRFDSGNYRQRKVMSYPLTSFRLIFVIERSKLFAWQSWINKNAYSWFDMTLIGPKSTANSEMAVHSIKFNSDLQISVLTEDRCRVTVSAILQAGA